MLYCQCDASHVIVKCYILFYFLKLTISVNQHKTKFADVNIVTEIVLKNFNNKNRSFDCIGIKTYIFSSTDRVTRNDISYTNVVKQCHAQLHRSVWL